MADLIFFIYSFLCVLAITLAYQVTAGAIYRLYYSPISHIPGPKLAALTLWYEFYYDIVLRGQYTFHLQTLHARYGPIIRINPYEVHISDPLYYDTLYASSASGEKRDKWEWSAKSFGVPESTASTIRHEHHRARRAAVSRYFSMASVQKLQPVIDERVRQLISRIRGFKDADGKAFKVNDLFVAFTNDVVSEYCFGFSEHLLETDDFGLEFHNLLLQLGKSAALMKQMYWIFQSIQSLPEWLAVLLSPGLGLLLQLQQKIKKKIVQVKAQPLSTYQSLAHPIIFHAILQSKLPESDKTVSHLSDEAVIIVGAGTLTSSWVLSVITYHLIANPRILSKLKAELKSAITDPDKGVPIEVLENLPYLVAVVKEALRLGDGSATRLQRISPEKPMLFIDRTGSGKEYLIPPQTPVGMTSFHIHHDESIFADAESFIPERWIENPGLSRFLVSFSKGSRNCLGINLAYAEIYLCIAAIFRRFGSGGKDGVREEGDEGVLELFETSLKDVITAADFIVPVPAKESEGIRIKVKV
ncbi:hypothetical protein MMC31_004542 [Peltigera leucophlebia]|nr:hypothetical protein [Peltigera leucophlebia]